MPSDSDMLAIILRRLDRIEGKLDSLSPTAGPNLLSIGEAAKQRGVSTDTIRRAITERRLRFVQSAPGAAIRIRPADLARWIEADAVEPIARRA